MKFHCPHCNQRIEAGAEFAGQVGECPSCSGKFTVPGQEAAPVQQSPGPGYAPQLQGGPKPSRLIGASLKGASIGAVLCGGIWLIWIINIWPGVIGFYSFGNEVPFEKLPLTPLGKVASQLSQFALALSGRALIVFIGMFVVTGFVLGIVVELLEWRSQSVMEKQIQAWVEEDEANMRRSRDSSESST